MATPDASVVLTQASCKSIGCWAYRHAHCHEPLTPLQRIAACTVTEALGAPEACYLANVNNKCVCDASSSHPYAVDGRECVALNGCPRGTGASCYTQSCGIGQTCSGSWFSGDKHCVCNEGTCFEDGKCVEDSEYEGPRGLDLAEVFSLEALEDGPSQIDYLHLCAKFVFVAVIMMMIVFCCKTMWQPRRPEDNTVPLLEA